PKPTGSSDHLGPNSSYRLGPNRLVHGAPRGRAQSRFGNFGSVILGFEGQVFELSQFNVFLDGEPLSNDGCRRHYTPGIRVVLLMSTDHWIGLHDLNR
ncbi:MAG: hypothetical protein AAFO70_07350, partial [Pseudomonadota bacterium]